MRIKRGASEFLDPLALILLSIGSKDVIEGRKKIQKMVYLANECCWNVIRDYTFYEYGPYSRWLSLELENLKDNKLIIEEKETENGQMTYLYSITDKGRLILDAILKELNEPQLVEVTKRLLEELAKYKPDELEIMASLWYIKKEREDLNNKEIVETVLHIKPRFTQEQIQKCLNVFSIIEEFRKKLST